MRSTILAAAVIALAAVGVIYTWDSGNGTDDSIESQPTASQDIPGIIFYTIRGGGIDVEEVHITNGSEIKKAFDLSDSNIEDSSKIAFIIFRYSAAEGADRKADQALATIYAALAAEPSIDGVMVMPYDPTDATGRTSMVYTNRSYALEVAVQNLTLRKFYNSFDVYAITREEK